MKNTFNNHTRLVQGLWHLENMSIRELYELILFDIEHGITTFDLADIYGNGESERKFGQVMLEHPELREKIYIQSKCGIVLDDDNVYYDSSYDHLKTSVENSIKRCHIDYFDSYLIHRPDVLMDIREVAKAYKEIYDCGLVKSFGVSNFPKEGIELFLDNGINVRVDQLQLGLGHLNLVKEILNYNINNNDGIMHAGDLLFYLKRKDIELQCWSPFQYEHFDGSIFTNEKMAPAMKVVKEIADKYHISMCGLLTNFILKLGDNVTLITGTCKKEHILEMLEGLDIDLSRKDWYRIYTCTGSFLP